MSRPSNPQPFAPVGAEVQYEAPHGLLKLRGGHDQPGTSAYPELDEKGVSVSLFLVSVGLSVCFRATLARFLWSGTGHPARGGRLQLRQTTPMPLTPLAHPHPLFLHPAYNR
jgi:hypothetical protein